MLLGEGVDPVAAPSDSEQPANPQAPQTRRSTLLPQPSQAAARGEAKT
jgi:hypothetical protein